MKRIVIWGTGSYATGVMRLFPEGGATLLAFVDSDQMRQGKRFFDREILAPGELPGLEFDLLAVASYAFDAIRQMALALGIDGSRIFEASELFEMSHRLPTRQLEHAALSLRVNHGEAGYGLAPDIMQTLALPAESGIHAACPICRGGYEPVYVNRHQRLIAGCRRCGHHFVVNPWPEQDVASFYQGFNYFTQNYAHQGMSTLEEDSEWAEWVSIRMGVIDTHCLPLLPNRPLSILEQGCLDGRILSVLASRGHNVIGCDVNAEVVRAGRKHFGVDLRLGTIETCGFEPESFDLVCSFHTIEHLRDPVRNLAATKALLKPGGMVFFEIPLNETAYENRDHLHFFSLDSVGKVMKSMYKSFGYSVNNFTDGGGRLIESALVHAFKE